MSVIPPEGLTRRIFGAGTGPDGCRWYSWESYYRLIGVWDLVARGYFISWGASQKRGESGSGVLCRTLSDRTWTILDFTRDVPSRWVLTTVLYSNFSNRPYPLAQNRATIDLVGCKAKTFKNSPSTASQNHQKRCSSSIDKMCVPHVRTKPDLKDPEEC